MPIATSVTNKSRNLLPSTTQATTSTDQTERNHRAIANDAQHTASSNQQAQRNTYGASVIGINSARAQWSIQESAIPSTEVKLDELDFTTGRCLGSGGQAKVLILVDQHGREFAGKVFDKPEDLEKEYKNYTNIGIHPNIAQCYGKKEVNGKEYLVMEKIPGKVLSKALEDLDNYCRIIPKDTAQYAPVLRLMLTEQLMDALNFLGEKGISHADLKPDNIFLSKDGQLKLIDFGLAKAHQEEPKCEGTIHYHAPETLVPGQKDSSKIDAYAAGNIALELLTGCYLRQKGSLSHRSEGHGGGIEEIYPAGDNFTNGKEPLNDFPLSASGSFFQERNKEDINNKNGEETQIHPNLPESFDQPEHTGINLQLEEQVIRALLRIHPKNRADIKVVHQAVKKMADENLTQEVREKAISLLQKMHHSPCEDFMQAERETVKTFIALGRNYANETVAYAEGGNFHCPDADEIAETRNKTLPDRNGIVWFNPDKGTCSVLMGAAPPPRKKSTLPTSESTSAKGGIHEKQKLEKEQLQLDKLKLDRQVSQQRLDKLKLKKLQEQQRNKSLAQPAAATQKAPVATSTANKKKTPLLAD